MKRFVMAVALLVVASAFADADENSVDSEILQRPALWAEVMLVGTYHFANPGRDMFNSKADDVLSERRQREIRDLVARLAEWKPDLVLLEYSRDEREQVNARYAEYREGMHRGKRNEAYQLGFRLADILGHERIAAVDVEHRFYSEQQAALDKAPKGRYRGLSEELQHYGKAFVAASDEVIASRSIGDILAWYNSPEALTANQDFYLNHQIRQWQGENQGGAHTIANWYKRNILIFQNILREVEESEGQAKRIVVIYGQGHIPILSQLVDDTPFLTAVDLAPYLADNTSEL